MKIAHHDLNERVMVVAEIGINHSGNWKTAVELIGAAHAAGADAVKFQVGDPRQYVNRALWDVPRDTPWGRMPYTEYREAMELTDDALAECQRVAHGLGMIWFASPLDVGAVDRLEALDVPCYKVASPMMTDHGLLDRIHKTGKPVILSSGMTTDAQLQNAAGHFNARIAILHCTSEYPCPPAHANLRCISALRLEYPYTPIGYSGHELGIPESLAAVALGARIVERHLTLSRASWGSDQAASLEPEGLRRLVGYIRTIEEALGDGVKVIYDEEGVNGAKFRKLDAPTPEPVN